MTVIPTQSLVPGRARGHVLALSEPLSFWGGLDPATGLIIGRHPQSGERMTGRVLAMSEGRGSSSSASVLAEAIRLGTAPAAIILEVPDAIIVVGALVAAELYGKVCPVVTVGAIDVLSNGQIVTVDSEREVLDLRER